MGGTGPKAGCLEFKVGFGFQKLTFPLLHLAPHRSKGGKVVRRLAEDVSGTNFGEVGEQVRLLYVVAAGNAWIANNGLHEVKACLGLRIVQASDWLIGLFLSERMQRHCSLFKIRNEA